MAELIFPDIIQKNLTSLINCTCNLSELLNNCNEQNILSATEVEDVKSKKTEYEKRTEFYSIIRRKGPGQYKSLLECFVKTGNEYIKNVLESCRIEPIWFDISQNNYSSYRKKELETIITHYNNWHSLKMKILAITGLAGVGKTHLAKAFARSVSDTANCVEINAESVDSFTQSFRNLAKRLGIHFDSSNSLLELSLEACERLSKMKIPTILILDNIEECIYEKDIFSSLIKFLSKLDPKQERFYVILTTRYTPVHKFCGLAVETIVLDVFNVEDSEKFLKDTLKIDERNKQGQTLAKRLAKVLGFHPLALRQAVAFISDNSQSKIVECRIRNYLKSLKSDTQKKILLSHPLSSCFHPQNRTMFLTFKSTFKTIVSHPENGQLSRQAMNTIAFLFSDCISIPFVMEIMRNCGTEIPKAKEMNADFMNILFDYCLIKRTDDLHCQSEILVHRIVQHVIRAYFKEQLETEGFIDKLMGGIEQIMTQRKIQVNEMIHVTTIWGHASKYINIIKRHATLSESICQLFRVHSMYRELHEFTLKAVPVYERYFGTDSRLTLKIMWWQGKSLQRTGFHHRALCVLFKTYQRQNALLGETNVETLKTKKLLQKYVTMFIYCEKLSNVSHCRNNNKSFRIKLIVLLRKILPACKIYG